MTNKKAVIILNSFIRTFLFATTTTIICMIKDIIVYFFPGKLSNDKILYNIILGIVLLIIIFILIDLIAEENVDEDTK